MWSVGCILAELLDGCPLFPGTTDIDQISRIGYFLGSPNDYLDVSIKVWQYTDLDC